MLRAGMTGILGMRVIGMAGILGMTGIACHAACCNDRDNRFFREGDGRARSAIVHLETCATVWYCCETLRRRGTQGKVCDAEEGPSVCSAIIPVEMCAMSGRAARPFAAASVPVRVCYSNGRASTRPLYTWKRAPSLVVRRDPFADALIRR